MLRYVFKRILLLIPVLLGVSFIVFSIMSLTPGDPASVILGPTATKEDIQKLNEELGYYRQTGNLVCTSDCTLDLSVCEEYCGDGVRHELYEDCDQQEFGGVTCDSLGLGGGNLACTSECIIDTSSCEIQPVCGDQVILEPVEECEGDDLQGESCQTQGFSGGTLASA